MTRVLLIRHAQSVWNREGRWQGWADPPLSDRGEAEARTAAATLATLAPGRLVASDLQRAVRTATLLSRDGGLDLRTDPDLREYDAGAWTGLRREEIAARWPAELAAWDDGGATGSPGGEDPAGFLDRVQRALRRLHRPDQAAGPVLAVSHGRAIAVVVRSLGVTTGRIGHLQGWQLDVTGDPGSEVLTVGQPLSLLRP